MATNKSTPSPAIGRKRLRTAPPVSNPVEPWRDDEPQVGHEDAEQVVASTDDAPGQEASPAVLPAAAVHPSPDLHAAQPAPRDALAAAIAMQQTGLDKPMTVRIPAQLHQRFKINTQLKGIHMQVAVAQAMEAWLAENKVIDI